MKVGAQAVVGFVIAVIIALSIGIGVTYVPSGAGTTSRTGLQTTTISRITSLTNTTTSQSLGMICSTPPTSNGTYYVDENSNLILCVRFYYYDSGAPINVAPTQQLSIGAVSNGPSLILTSPSSSAMSNFTVTAQPSNFSIGGTSNENEGILVEYDIHPLANSNGSYILDLGWLAPQIQTCWAELELVVGNGVPNYYPYGTTCQTLTEIGTTSTNSPYPSGTLFAEVVGSEHSTS